MLQLLEGKGLVRVFIQDSGGEEHTQPKRGNNLIKRTTNLLNNQGQLSRQSRSSSLAGLDRDIALHLRGAHGFDIVGCVDDLGVDGSDGGGEGCGGGGFVGF